MASTTRRQRRTSRRTTNEFLGMIISCIGAYAMLFGLLPALANGALGLLLLGGALLGAVLHVVLGPRQGKTVIRALIEALIVSSVTFALIYGCMWYFTVYLASQPGLMQFNLGAPTSAP
ncbi:MAG: hypothetical protein EI684_02455 [Candidatus Viridilinea halotolerans]|uniref:Uncharacterized protein n=1 Tax=Candidatus Viridilinea halotolerans TaxID=2491704 RepID=A0A426U8V0_9CHLR|nr:MAG: hypothetical protein EI684_02455 [Candidatus Viridilinea halotolerans]